MDCGFESSNAFRDFKKSPVRRIGYDEREILLKGDFPIFDFIIELRKRAIFLVFIFKVS